MADCLITSGIDASCADLTRVGGVRRKAYLFNLEEKSGYNFSDGYLTTILFPTYKGLYEVKANNKSHSGGSQVIRPSAGGNKYFQHDAILKMFDSSPEDDEFIESLLNASIGIILETNNNEFIGYGFTNGMELITGVQNTGQEAGSDTTTTATFQGEEPLKPFRILRTDYETTKAYLNSLVVA